MPQMFISLRGFQLPQNCKKSFRYFKVIVDLIKPITRGIVKCMFKGDLIHSVFPSPILACLTVCVAAVWLNRLGNFADRKS